MALTNFQRSICQLLVQSRIASGESYLAEGATLNELLGATRIARDVDLFHDTETALDATWQSDRKLFEQAGLTVRVIRERASFVEAEVTRGGDALLLQWVRDSAYVPPQSKRDSPGLLWNEPGAAGKRFPDISSPSQLHSEAISMDVVAELRLLFSTLTAIA